MTRIRPRPQTWGRRWLRRWGLLVGAIALMSTVLFGSGGVDGALAQSTGGVQRAPVVLDGQPLFEVTSFRGVSANQRASQIVDTLESWVDEDDLPTVRVDPDANSTILLDGEHLLTVTKTDAALSQRTPSEQARVWASDIRQALSQAQRERSPGFLRQAIILAGLAIALAGGTSWWLGKLQRRLSENPFQQFLKLISGRSLSEQAEAHPLGLLFSLLLLIVRIGVWIGAVLYITNLFPFTRERTYAVVRQVIGVFVSPVFPLGDNVYSIIDLVILVGAFFLVIVGATLIANLFRSRILQLAGLSSGSQEAIAALTRYILIALGGVVVLQVWGLDLSSLTLLASALGVGIGFGLQDIARDFSSGLVLLFERSIQVGDFIEVGDFMGTVDRIGARSTTIKTLAQVSVIVPNSYFLENQVINWSHDNPLSRIAVPVGVSYNANPLEVKEVLLQAGREHASVVKMPSPQVFFKGFGDSALNFELLVWILEPNRQPVIRSELYFSIFELLHQNGIEIPFPQRDLHIRTGTLPIEWGDRPTVSSQPEINGNGDPSAS